MGEAHVTDDTITVSHLLFNEIDSSYLTARYALKEDDSFFTDTKKILSVNSPVLKALKEKTESPTLSTSRKVDYIEFYKALHPDKKKFVSVSVQNIIDKELKMHLLETKEKWSLP